MQRVYITLLLIHMLHVFKTHIVRLSKAHIIRFHVYVRHLLLKILPHPIDLLTLCIPKKQDSPFAHYQPCPEPISFTSKTEALQDGPHNSMPHVIQSTLPTPPPPKKSHLYLRRFFKTFGMSCDWNNILVLIHLSQLVISTIVKRVMSLEVLIEKQG